MIEILKVVIINGEEHLITELIESEPVEFRVYHDDDGKVLFYTCEKPEGKYITIDNITFAEKRYDSRVIDGKLVRYTPGIMIRKYHDSDSGIITAAEDISIVVDDDYSGETKKWEMKKYEL